MAQEKTIKVADMSKEQLMELTYDDLLSLSFEDLIAVSDKFGMSADELLDYFLNKEVTSASKRAEKSLNSPLSATVISKDELVASGVTSIPEALRLVPGMIVREKTNGVYDVHIRGNDNVPAKSMFVYSEDAMTLVMIDGRPVYNYAFGGTFWETLPIDIADVERIEVIRGPSSALYGPNAVSGAINIVTKQVETNKMHVDGQVQAGNAKATFADLAMTGGVSKLKYRLSGNYTRLGRFENDFYEFDLNKKLTAEQCDTLTYYWDATKKGMRVFRDTSLTEGDFYQRFTDLEISNQKYGANAFLFYNLNKNVNLRLSTGAQHSDVISTTLGNHDIPLVGRITTSQYADFGADFYGFHLQVNHNLSNQEVEKNSIGWHIIAKTTNANLEYEHKFGSLVLRPGVGYQKALNDDSKYINPAKKEGFLNGEKEINALSGSLRADYLLAEKLRLIAALRAEKYNYPNKTYFTYQFIASYNFNENNLLRAVYSRANRGPFVVDMHADYAWYVTPENNLGYTPTTITWNGNKNLKLPVMDMYELGYRSKPVKKVMFDLEAFYTKTRDFSYFIADTMTVVFDFYQQKINSINSHLQYYNFDLETLQKGITANVSVAISPKLTFRLFGTVQETKMNNFYDKTLFMTMNEMSGAITNQVGADGYILGKYMADPSSLTADELARLMQLDPSGVQTYKLANPSMQDGKIVKDSLTDTYNKSTPSFFGGGSVDYKPTDKLTISSTFYYFSENKLLHAKYDAIKDPSVYTVDPKFIMNLKVDYKFYKNNSVLFNARNLLNDESREFAYVDKVKGLYMVGLSIHF
jgi:iron complex outermembrane receptor protein